MRMGPNNSLHPPPLPRPPRWSYISRGPRPSPPAVKGSRAGLCRPGAAEEWRGRGEEGGGERGGGVLGSRQRTGCGLGGS